MYTVQPTRRNHSHRSNVDEGVSTMGGGFHGCDVLILAFLLTSYVQNLSTANFGDGQFFWWVVRSKAQEYLGGPAQYR